MTRPSLWTTHEASANRAARRPNREPRTPRQDFTSFIRIYEQFNDAILASAEQDPREYLY